jgi:hypothetical protein
MSARSSTSGGKGERRTCGRRGYCPAQSTHTSISQLLQSREKEVRELRSHLPLKTRLSEDTEGEGRGRSGRLLHGQYEGRAGSLFGDECEEEEETKSNFAKLERTSRDASLSLFSLQLCSIHTASRYSDGP